MSHHHVINSNMTRLYGLARTSRQSCTTPGRRPRRQALRDLQARSFRQPFGFLKQSLGAAKRQAELPGGDVTRSSTSGREREREGEAAEEGEQVPQPAVCVRARVRRRSRSSARREGLAKLNIGELPRRRSRTGCPTRPCFWLDRRVRQPVLRQFRKSLRIPND